MNTQKITKQRRKVNRQEYGTDKICINNRKRDRQKVNTLILWHVFLSVSLIFVHSNFVYPAIFFVFRICLGRFLCILFLSVPFLRIHFLSVSLFLVYSLFLCFVIFCLFNFYCPVFVYSIFSVPFCVFTFCLSIFRIFTFCLLAR